MARWSADRAAVRRGPWQHAKPSPRNGAGVATDKRLAVALAECIRAAWERDRPAITNRKHLREVRVIKEEASRGKAA
jgi:hypothetical protein